jgi:hypothetical protein
MPVFPSNEDPPGALAGFVERSRRVRSHPENFLQSHMVALAALEQQISQRGSQPDSVKTSGK